MGLMDRASGAYAKFEPGMVPVTGIVRSVREYESTYNGVAKKTQAGKPVVAFEITLAGDDGDDLIVDTDKWRHIQAIQRAALDVGITSDEGMIGWRLTTACTGTEKGKGTEPAKLFTAEFSRGDVPKSQPARLLGDAPEPTRPAHIAEALWGSLTPDQRRQVAAAPPF